MTTFGEFSPQATEAFMALEERRKLVQEHEEDMAWASREPLLDPFEDMYDD